MEPIRAIATVGLSELTKPQTSLEKQVSKSRLDGLKLALQKFSLLRGEVMDAMRLESFSRAIAEEFPDDNDALQVMDKMVRSPRQEFEPRIPAMGDFLQMIRDLRSARRRQERDAEEQKAWSDRLQDIQDHPENYVRIEEVWAEMGLTEKGRRPRVEEPEINSLES